MFKKSFLVVTLLTTTAAFAAEPVQTTPTPVRNKVTAALSKVDEFKNDLNELSTFVEATINLQAKDFNEALTTIINIKKGYDFDLKDRAKRLTLIIETLSPVLETLENKHPEMMEQYKKLVEYLATTN